MLQNVDDLKKMTMKNIYNTRIKISKAGLIIAATLLLVFSVSSPFLHHHKSLVEPAECAANVFQHNLVASGPVFLLILLPIPQFETLQIFSQTPVFSVFTGFLFANKAPPVA